jgi:hypothetical protein
MTVMRLRTCAATGGLVTVLLAVALLPALLGRAPTAAGCGIRNVEVDRIAATIRALESGGDYTARAAGSSASGAYQFLDSSWADYGGYPRAWLAPPEVQDAKAAQLITAILAAHSGDVTAVPVSWYLGHVPAAGSPEWDTIPAPGAGNRLTPRQYQARWMAHYDSLASSNADATAAEGAGCATSSGEVLPGGWALLGPRELLEATADQLDNPHHDYPAWDWAIPTGTPITAIRGGTVTALTTNTGNCYGLAGCVACGLGVIVTDIDLVTWTYCHGSRLHVAVGDQVSAGQQILTSGNSGNSTGPHLHLAVRVAGVARCPQPLIESLVHLGAGIAPSALPSTGCTF